MKDTKIHSLLSEWSQWIYKSPRGLGFSSKSHTEGVGLPSNPITRQLGDLKDLPMYVAKHDLSHLDTLIRSLKIEWQNMIAIRYLGGMTEQAHRKEIGMGRTKYYYEWTDIYKTLDKGANIR